EPCVKIKRAEAVSEMTSVSRIIPTAIEAVINAEDAILLEYAYTTKNQFPWMTSLFRIAATEWGWSISSQSLRQAILAFSAFLFPKSQFYKIFEYHKSLARHFLIQTLGNPVTVCFADVLAAFILGQLTVIRDQGRQEDEGSNHFEGCIAMVKALSEQ